MSGKTSVYKVLAKSLCKLSEMADERGEQSVECHLMNPKSISISELYGTFDAISHEFTDGVLSKVFRECASGTKAAKRQWIIFDGPVDAEWVENMNTVLDDNKKLCLLHGEVILMNDGMSMIFETDDLT